MKKEQSTFGWIMAFAVLGNIRRQGLAKLARMPLGDIQAKGSGALKNILVERVDSIEPTLAHVIPEMSSNAAVALATLIYLFVIDWRMALASLITFPLGMVFFLLMMAGYNKNYTRTAAATNTLNDTAVEYIGGIEVIKVFGKAKSSYEKFVSAAKECARSYIDWMNKSNFYFTFAMNIMPATLLSVLPIGGLLLENSFDTMAGSGGGHLSGGEKQRISIARAMMKDAPIIILDEATANVDPENEKELMDAIRELTQEKTVIMIAHRLKTVRRADQILVVNKGRIAQRGTHDQLLAQDGIYRRFILGRAQALPMIPPCHIPINQAPTPAASGYGDLSCSAILHSLPPHQLHDPPAVISLHHHEQRVAPGRQHGRHDKHRIRAEPAARRDGQEAQHNDRFVHQLRLARGLRDLVPGVRPRVKQRGVIGGHPALPPLHPQPLVQGHLPLAHLVPPLPVVRSVLHPDGKCKPHQQPHHQVIRGGPARDGQREPDITGGLPIQNGHHARRRRDQHSRQLHRPCHVRSPPPEFMRTLRP